MKWPNLPPRSLFGRTALVIATLVFASHLLSFFLIRHNPGRPAIPVGPVVSAARNVRIAMNWMGPLQSLQYARELSREGRLKLMPIRPGETPPGEEPTSQSMRALAAAVREQLGTGSELRIYPDEDRGVIVRIDTRQGPFWIEMPMVRHPQPIGYPVLGWLLFSGALALVGAFLLMWRTARPLRDLGLAAAQLGKGENIPPVVERGPEEMRALARSFNQMAAGLRQLEGDRALLLAGVSHDLRTPLARLRLGAEMLPDDQPLKAGMIEDIEDMDAVISQFLGFVRDSGGEAVDAQADLNTIIRGVADRYARTGRPLALQLTNVPVLPLKPLAIQRLITNLVDNAYKYGAQTVTVQTVRGAHEVVLSLLDDGPGIPPEDIQRMLQPFTRLDHARSNVTGSGLGLAIVHRIVLMHDARLQLLPRVSGGLEARIEFPLLPTV